MESAPVDFRTSQQEKTVLKKAGIIVAATAAGLFAVAPLAFASPDDNKGGDRTDVDYTQVETHYINCEANDVQAADQEARGVGLLLGAAIPVSVQLNDLFSNECSPGAQAGLVHLDAGNDEIGN
jgi:hypothetical protein